MVWTLHSHLHPCVPPHSSCKPWWSQEVHIQTCNIFAFLRNCFLEHLTNKQTLHVILYIYILLWHIVIFGVMLVFTIIGCLVSRIMSKCVLIMVDRMPESVWPLPHMSLLRCSGSSRNGDSAPIILPRHLATLMIGFLCSVISPTLSISYPDPSVSPFKWIVES